MKSKIILSIAIIFLSIFSYGCPLNNTFGETELRDTTRLPSVETKKANTGYMQIHDANGKLLKKINGFPEVVDRGQIGMHDVVLDPSFSKNKTSKTEKVNRFMCIFLFF